MTPASASVSVSASAAAAAAASVDSNISETVAGIVLKHHQLIQYQ